MKKSFLIIILLFLFIVGSVVVMAQTRRTKEDDFTKSSFVISEKEDFSYTIVACDPDGDPINITLENVPNGMIIIGPYPVMNPDPSLFPSECGPGSSQYKVDIEWTPSYTQAGVYKIYAHAEDDQGGDDWVNYVITVINQNRPPIL